MIPSHLDGRREISVIISTHSGQHTAEQYFHDTLVPFLQQHEINYKEFFTTSNQTVIELTERIFIPNACKGVKQTIILLSGDGGVIDIVNTIATSLQRSADDSRPPSIFVKPVVALIPHGTANALAWSSGVAKDPLHVLVNGRPTAVPIFEAAFSPGARLVTQEGTGREPVSRADGAGNPKVYGAVVFSWGLHASLVAQSDTAAYRKHGLERFKMVAAKLLAENHAYKGLIQVRTTNGSHGSSSWAPLLLPSQLSDHDSDTSPQIRDQSNDQSQTSSSYIMATLVSNLEEHFCISPASTPLDRTLRLVAIPHLPASTISKLVYLPYTGGQHVRDPNVTYSEIEGLQIDFLENGDGAEDGGGPYRQVCVDGKIVEVEAGGWVEVRMMPALGTEGRRVIELVK